MGTKKETDRDIHVMYSDCDYLNICRTRTVKVPWHTPPDRSSSLPCDSCRTRRYSNTCTVPVRSARLCDDYAAHVLSSICSAKLNIGRRAYAGELHGRISKTHHHVRLVYHVSALESGLTSSSSTGSVQVQVGDVRQESEDVVPGAVRLLSPVCSLSVVSESSMVVYEQDYT